MSFLESLSLPAFGLQTCLVFLLVFLITWCIYISWARSTRNLPPGPKGLIAAMIFNIRSSRIGSSNPLFGRMRQIYKSDIVGSTAGWQVGIILNTFDLIKDSLFKRDDLADRPKSFALNMFGENRGILGSNGAAWKEIRRFTISVLRDFGMGKNLMEKKITEEAIELNKELRKHNGKNLDLQYLLGLAVSNIICSIVFGQRYNHDDKEFLGYLKMVNDFVTKSRLAVLAVDVFPFLQYLPGDLFHVQELKENQKRLLNHFNQKINEHMDTLDPDNIRSFIDAYLLEMEKRRKVDPDTSINEEQLPMIINDLFLAGSETTASTLRWAFLFLILNPEIQRKVHAEIDDVIGRERHPTYSDRTKMPYTEAVLMEIHRTSSIIPFGAPHGNVHQDVEIGGYVIPKDAMVASNIWAVHHDPEHWKYPNEFNPNNFLDGDGRVLPNEHLIPFLIGRRSCPGEALAKMELFIFFTAILQRFEFKIPEGAEKPTTDGNLSLALTPKPFEVLINTR